MDNKMKEINKEKNGKTHKLVAVASSDGIAVDEHFGRSAKFYICDLTDASMVQREIREVTPVCAGGNHDEEAMDNNLKSLSDCRYLLVSRIGNNAALAAKRYGIESYEIPGIITESLDQMIRFLKIKELFSGKE